jgi:hypothetical protein
LSDWYAVEGVRCWVDVYCIKGTELDGQQSAKRNREQRRNGFHNIRSVVTSSRNKSRRTTEGTAGNSSQQRVTKQGIHNRRTNREDSRKHPTTESNKARNPQQENKQRGQQETSHNRE